MGITEEGKRKIRELMLEQDDGEDLTIGRWVLGKLEERVGYPLDTAETFSLAASLSMLDELGDDLKKAARLKIEGYDELSIGARNRMKLPWVGYQRVEFWLAKLFVALYDQTVGEFDKARFLLREYEKSVRGEEEPIAKITWLPEDLREALADEGFKPSDENIEVLLDNRLRKTIEDLSIERGWDIIFDVIGMCQEELEEDENADG